MIKHKQEFRHDPENGVYGDCFRTSIACMLDLKREQVPHFLGDGDVTQGIERAQRFLKFFNLALIQLPMQGTLEEVLTCGDIYAAGVHYFIVGESRTGCNHIVICKDDEIVHDTSLDDAGIIGPADDGYLWLGFLARSV
jgi:hypothetical protein